MEKHKSKAEEAEESRKAGRLPTPAQLNAEQEERKARDLPENTVRPAGEGPKPGTHSIKDRPAYEAGYKAGFNDAKGVAVKPKIAAEARVQ